MAAQEDQDRRAHLPRSFSTPAINYHPLRPPLEEGVTELSPLLSSRVSIRIVTPGGSPVTPRRSGWRGGPSSSRPGQHRDLRRIRSLRRALATALGDQQNPHRRRSVATPGEHLHETEDESAYDQFTSIDWVRDNISAALRSRQLHVRRDMLGYLLLWWDDAQGWVLAGVVGVLVAVIAYLVDICEPILFDLKFGYCRNRLFTSSRTCCSGADFCDDWIGWTSHTTNSKEKNHLLGFLVFVASMLVMSLAACAIALSYQRITPSKLAESEIEKDNATTSDNVSATAAVEKKNLVLYPVAGSGVAEVKVIASGFIIHGFLGMRTLILKAIGCTLSVASGISVGKEGPYVHIAACIGNVMARLSPKYDRNSARRREIISAASAAGVAVAFGAPVSGVLFSLEEVSYYFPAKTLFRTFFCSIMAAVTLRALNPYGTSKIVLFEVNYHTDWQAWELVMFIILGALGGALGALFVKSTRIWSTTFRKLPLIRSSAAFEVALVAVISGVMSYWNRYTKLAPASLMLELASDCHRLTETGTGLCPAADEIPNLLRTLAAAFVVKAFLTVIAFGIKVPAGIYIPSMCVGGLLGRALGHTVQYLLVNNTGLSCGRDGRLESCIVPGVYALLTAGSVMVGVTRLTITIAIMLFELSGSINFVLPFSIAVMFAKWTADAVEPLSIYDLLMETNQYPFLDSKVRPSLTGELADLIPPSRPEEKIDISDGPLISAKDLFTKLKAKIDSGRTDAGFPIIKEGVLIGTISCPDLAFCLDGVDINDDVQCLISPRAKYEGREDDDEADPTDFTAYIDPAPLCLDIYASTEMVYECFIKLGVRYIAGTRDGFYVGLVHKKAFLAHLRQLKDRS